MKISDWVKKCNLTSLKINDHFLEVELNFQVTDKKAAWELYVELLTRITAQPLPSEHGDEETALKRVFSLFGITREILKKYGVESIEFAKFASIILNQIVRPFTAKWHKLSLENDFENKDRCLEFRKALEMIQGILKKNANMLSEIAEVEDITKLQD